MKRSCGASLIVLALMFSVAVAAEHRLEVADQAAPSDGVSAAIGGELSTSCLKVLRGAKRPVCEIWLRKAWPIKGDFAPSGEVLYPFAPGELIGLVRYPQKGEDFRGQEIAAGVYTLRYAQQPVDGNHVGTSETRDFLLLLRAADDTALAAPDEQTLIKLSTQASGTTHPAMLCLLVAGEGATDAPEIRHHEERDLWSVRVVGLGAVSEKQQALPVRLVVVGTAEEA